MNALFRRTLPILPLLLAGCGTVGPVPPPSAPAAPPPAEIRLVPGGTSVLELEENATTGYSWTGRSSDPAVTVTLRHLPPPDNHLCGAPGKVQVTLKAAPDFRNGSAAVTLEYARPWEKDTPPIESIRIRIVPETADGTR